MSKDNPAKPIQPAEPMTPERDAALLREEIAANHAKAPIHKLNLKNQPPEIAPVMADKIFDMLIAVPRGPQRDFVHNTFGFILVLVGRMVVAGASEGVREPRAVLASALRAVSDLIDREIAAGITKLATQWAASGGTDAALRQRGHEIAKATHSELMEALRHQYADETRYQQLIEAITVINDIITDPAAVTVNGGIDIPPSGDIAADNDRMMRLIGTAARGVADVLDAVAALRARLLAAGRVAEAEVISDYQVVNAKTGEVANVRDLAREKDPSAVPKPTGMPADAFGDFVAPAPGATQQTNPLN